MKTEQKRSRNALDIYKDKRKEGKKGAAVIWS